MQVISSAQMGQVLSLAEKYGASATNQAIAQVRPIALQNFWQDCECLQRYLCLLCGSFGCVHCSKCLAGFLLQRTVCGIVTLMSA